MRLHAYITQAISPSVPSPEASVLTQFPNINEEDVKNILQQLDNHDVRAFVEHLEKTHDPRAEQALKAAESWGKLELVETSFKGMCPIRFFLHILTPFQQSSESVS